MEPHAGNATPRRTARWAGRCGFRAKGNQRAAETLPERAASPPPGWRRCCWTKALRAKLIPASCGNDPGAVKPNPPSGVFQSQSGRIEFRRAVAVCVVLFRLGGVSERHVVYSRQDVLLMEINRILRPRGRAIASGCATRCHQRLRSGKCGPITRTESIQPRTPPRRTVTMAHLAERELPQPPTTVGCPGVRWSEREAYDIGPPATPV
jgi:hypothetical protein